MIIYWSIANSAVRVDKDPTGIEALELTTIGFSLLICIYALWIKLLDHTKYYILDTHTYVSKLL